MIILGLYLVTWATYREKQQAILGGRHSRASESPLIGHIFAGSPTSLPKIVDWQVQNHGLLPKFISRTEQKYSSRNFHLRIIQIVERDAYFAPTLTIHYSFKTLEPGYFGYITLLIWNFTFLYLVLLLNTIKTLCDFPFHCILGFFGNCFMLLFLFLYVYKFLVYTTVCCILLFPVNCNLCKKKKKKMLLVVVTYSKQQISFICML